MIACLNWLPEKSVTDIRLAEPFSAIFSDWAKHWFSTSGWPVSEHWTRKSGAIECSLVAFEIANCVSCYISERSKMLIAGAMLGLPLDKGRPQKADAHLINALAQKALSDLENRLSALHIREQRTTDLVGGGNVFEEQGYEISVGSKVGPMVIALRASREFLVGLAQSIAPPPRPFPTLPPRSEAVQESEVAVGAKIGVVRLKLSQVHELGVGDVLAFDGPIGSLVGMTVNGTEAASSAFRVKITENILELELMRSLS